MIDVTPLAFTLKMSLPKDKKKPALHFRMKVEVGEGWKGGECERETVCEGWLDGTFILTVLSREESMS